MTTISPKPRVVIDTKANGDFFIFSDPGVEVICRAAHVPEDELFAYDRHPIPAGWLRDKPIGYLGDGSEVEKRMKLKVEEMRAEPGA